VFVAANDLRDAINNQLTEADIELLGPKKWQAICASMDVLADTSLAIEAAEHSFHEWRQDGPLGQKYLTIYGFLQSIVLQQDALRCIAQYLPIDHPERQYSQASKRLRKLRILVAGHPVDGKRYPTNWGISRPTIRSSEGVKVYEFGIWDNAGIWDEISFKELVQKHVEEMISSISTLLTQLLQSTKHDKCV